MIKLIREGVATLQIRSHRNGMYYVHFGFEAIEGGYAAYVKAYKAEPSLSLVNKHVSEIDSRYAFTQQEWEDNLGHAIV